MNKIQSKTRFCDGSVQPDVLLDPGTRSAWPGWSLEHRLFAELVCTGQTQQLSEAYTRPLPGEKAGNPTNLFHEEKRLVLLSSCHWGSSFRKPELRKQSMLIGTCENFPLCGRGIKLLLESPFFIFEALQKEPSSKLRLSVSKAFHPQWKLSVFPSSTMRGTGLSFHFSSNTRRVVLSQHFKDCFLGCRELTINILFLSPSFISMKSLKLSEDWEIPLSSPWQTFILAPINVIHGYKLMKERIMGDLKIILLPSKGQQEPMVCPRRRAIWREGSGPASGLTWASLTGSEHQAVRSTSLQEQQFHFSKTMASLTFNEYC